jgi:hypothetical protein
MWECKVKSCLNKEKGKELNLRFISIVQSREVKKDEGASPTWLLQNGKANFISTLASISTVPTAQLSSYRRNADLYPARIMNSGHPLS